ncbi:MAG: hypothetical protein ACRDGA_13430 [Bacteroidota bacterium]
MAAQRVTVLKANLTNRPGALLRVMKELKAKNLGLAGLWGFATSGGKAELYLAAKNPAKTKAVLRKSRVFSSEMTVFSVRGRDRTGALNSTLELLARKGVNIMAVHAIAVGKGFGSYIWVNSRSARKAARALRAR